MIKYKCAKCGATLESPVLMAGQEDKCPVCGQVCVVPQAKNRLPLILAVCGAGVAVVILAVAVAWLWPKGNDPKESSQPREADAGKVVAKAPPEKKVPTPPSQNDRARPKPPPATKPKPPPATKPKAPAATKPKPAHTTKPKAPAKLAHLKIPSGNAFVIDLGSPPEIKQGHITLHLKCDSAAAPATSPDGATVLFITKDADLTAGPGDYSGPGGIIWLWRKFIAQSAGFMETSGRNARGQLTCGLSKFEVVSPLTDQRLTVRGTLAATLEALSPRVVAVVLMGGGKPISNVLWVDLDGQTSAKPDKVER